MRISYLTARLIDYTFMSIPMAYPLPSPQITRCRQRLPLTMRRIKLSDGSYFYGKEIPIEHPPSLPDLKEIAKAAWDEMVGNHRNVCNRQQQRILLAAKRNRHLYVISAQATSTACNPKEQLKEEVDGGKLKRPGAIAVLYVPFFNIIVCTSSVKGCKENKTSEAVGFSNRETWFHNNCAEMVAMGVVSGSIKEREDLAHSNGDAVVGFILRESLRVRLADAAIVVWDVTSSPKQPCGGCEYWLRQFNVEWA